MPKKYVLVLAAATVGLVAAAGATLLVRRSRVEVPPVSPTVPRVEDLGRANGIRDAQLAAGDTPTAESGAQAPSPQSGAGSTAAAS